VLFAWLRVRSGSLLAPVLLHLATNALGTLAAAAAHRLG
jgi:membrane protease YdiL (CAAX protease family)